MANSVEKSDESGLELKIDAVFSLATETDGDNVNPDNSGDSKTTSFTSSTVSADEHEIKDKQSEEDMEIDDANISGKNLNTDLASPVVEALANSDKIPKIEWVDDSGVLDHSKDENISVNTLPDTSRNANSICAPTNVQQKFHKPLNGEINAKRSALNESIVTSKKFSYCYVKLTDVLQNKLIQQKIVKMENEKHETEPKSEPIKTKKKKAKPRPRLTMKKKKKKKPDPGSVPVETDKSTEGTVCDTQKEVKPSETRPSRKRKFNHKLFTDSVVFDSRGICNFEDPAISRMKEEDAQYYPSLTYGYRGCRPQVARTKKKLCRIKREDMPFVSVTLDMTEVEKVGRKGKYGVPKKKKNIPISALLSRKVRYYHTLQKIDTDRFRILKSKNKHLQNIARKLQRHDGKKRHMMNTKQLLASKGKETTRVTDGNTTTSSLVNTKTLPTKSVISSDPLTASVTNISDNGSLDYDIQNRVPCSLTGRCRKANDKYGSFITEFGAGWAQVPKIKSEFKKFPSIKQEIPETEPNSDKPTSDPNKPENAPDELSATVTGNCKSLLKNKIKSKKDAGDSGQMQTNSKPLSKSKTKRKKRAGNGMQMECIPNTATTQYLISSTGSLKLSVPPNSLLKGQDNVKNILSGSSVPQNVTSATGSKTVSQPSKDTPMSGSQPSVFANTVNELAKVQNTKKFFQLRVGDKIVLIPADGGDIIPKAYVMDVANASDLKGGAGVKQSKNIYQTHQQTIPTIQSGGQLTGDNIKYPSLLQTQQEAAPSMNKCQPQLVIKAEPPSDRTSLSPPLLSPQIEETKSFQNSKPSFTLSGQEAWKDSLTVGTHEQNVNNMKPPVLLPEASTTSVEPQISGPMKSILPRLMSGGHSFQSSVSATSLLDQTSPPVSVPNVQNSAITIKKEPAHLRCFEAGSSRYVECTDSSPMETDFAGASKKITESYTPSTTSSYIAGDTYVSKSIMSSQIVQNDKCSVEGTVSPSTTSMVSSVFHPENGVAITTTSSSVINHDTSNTRVPTTAPTVVSGNSCDDLETSVPSRMNTTRDIISLPSSSATSFGVHTNLTNLQSSSGSFEASVSSAPLSSSQTGTEDTNKPYQKENITFIPPDETKVQERIRKLRERLLEKQADLENARMKLKIKKESDDEV